MLLFVATHCLTDISGSDASFSSSFAGVLLGSGVAVWVLRSVSPGLGQLIPLYTASGPQWEKACSLADGDGRGSLVVADVQQGPGTRPSPAWEKAIGSCGRRRAVVLGYVWTDYGRGGMIGLPSIERQVRAWYALYPGRIGGIFFDGVSDTVPGTSVSNQRLCHVLAGYVHSQQGAGQRVVLNFGDNPVSGWMFDGNPEQDADLIVTFEGTYQTGSDRLVSWTLASWELQYPAGRWGFWIAANHTVGSGLSASCSSN